MLRSCGSPARRTVAASTQAATYLRHVVPLRKPREKGSAPRECCLSRIVQVSKLRFRRASGLGGQQRRRAGLEEAVAVLA